LSSSCAWAGLKPVFFSLLCIPQHGSLPSKHQQTFWVLSAPLRKKHVPLRTLPIQPLRTDVARETSRRNSILCLASTCLSTISTTRPEPVSHRHNTCQCQTSDLQCPHNSPHQIQCIKSRFNQLPSSIFFLCLSRSRLQTNPCRSHTQINHARPSSR
jgi:hypothetical protein